MRWQPMQPCFQGIRALNERARPMRAAAEGSMHPPWTDVQKMAPRDVSLCAHMTSSRATCNGGCAAHTQLAQHEGICAAGRGDYTYVMRQMKRPAVSIAS
jgi:hypothetical protein